MGFDDSNDESDDPDDFWLLTIQDADGFALATERFLQGQKKVFLAIGEEGYPSIAEFLDESSLRKADQAKVAISRLVTFRHSILLGKLWRWQNVRADNARAANNTEEEVTILMQNLRLYDQAVAPQETSALNALESWGFLRQYTYEALEKHVNEDSMLVEQAVMNDLRQREEELRIEAAILKLALQTLDDESYPKEYARSWSAMFSVVTSTSAALLFSAGVFLLTAKLLSKRLDSAPAFGILRHVVAWTVGFGSTFVVLGMAPAEMISHDVQRLAIVTGIWILAICIIAVAVWFVVRQLRVRKLRFRLLTLFAATGIHSS